LRLLGGAILSGVSQAYAPKSAHASEMDNAVRFLSANATGENDYKAASLSSSGVINFRYLVVGMGLRQVLSNVTLLYSPDALVRWLSIYRRAFFKRKLRHRVIDISMVMACFHPMDYGFSRQRTITKR
jgi:hypothetical protein